MTKDGKMSKTYYAARHAYGTEFCNDYTTLFRFATKAERDEFVFDSNFHEAGTYGGYRTEAVTRDRARKLFPRAFRVLDFHVLADERDWMDGATATSSYWNEHNIYC